MEATLDHAREAKAVASQYLPPGVKISGLGITRMGGAYALKVNLFEEPHVALPGDILGIKVLYSVVGRVKAR